MSQPFLTHLIFALSLYALFPVTSAQAQSQGQYHFIWYLSHKQGLAVELHQTNSKTWYSIYKPQSEQPLYLTPEISEQIGRTIEEGAERFRGKKTLNLKFT